MGQVVCPMKLRELTVDNDRERLEAFLLRDALPNVHPLSGLQPGGSTMGVMRYWGVLHEDELVGLVTIVEDLHASFAHCYASRDRALKLMAGFVSRQDITHIFGLASIVEPLSNSLPAYRVRRLDHYQLRTIREGQFKSQGFDSARRAGPDDVEGLTDIYMEYGLDGYRGRAQVKQAVRRFLRGTGYTVLERDGKIVSAVRITAETNDAAFLDAVTTLPDYRGQRLSEATRSLMFSEVIKAGKRPIGLIKDDNIASLRGSKRMGTSALERFCIVRLRPPKPLWRRVVGGIRRRLGANLAVCRN